MISWTRLAHAEAFQSRYAMLADGWCTRRGSHILETFSTEGA